MNQVYQTPSFYAYIANGLLLLLSVIIMFVYHKKIFLLDPIRLLILLLIISIAIGVHGLMHLGLEKVYGYNPILFLSKFI